MKSHSAAQSLPEQVGRGAGDWPIEIRALINALRTSVYISDDRRKHRRRPYEVAALLWFKDDRKQVSSTPVFTRDATGFSAAFVTQMCLKPGQSVILEVPAPGGADCRLQGHIRRCRQFRDGWFDCVMSFNESPARTRIFAKG